MLSYERPSLIRLSGLKTAVGNGASCHNGTNDQGNCKYGFAADSSCNNGTSAKLGSCNDGSSPGTTCVSGHNDN